MPGPDEHGWTESPVHAGGFVPALKPEHQPIHSHPEIVDDVPIPGAFVPVVLPVRGGVVELTQTTLTDGNGFFTLIDDVCWR